MRIDELDYDLPPDRIAQEPAARREDARLFVIDGPTDRREHQSVRDLPAYLRAGDLLVCNDTRVLPARLFARRDTGGRVEVFLLEEEALPGGVWQALLRAGGSPAVGEEVAVAEGDRVLLEDKLPGGRWRVRGVDADLRSIMARHGRMPLPPYIRRDPSEGGADARETLDRERYQTCFARREGAVAAPTAGLHLTPALLDQLRAGHVTVATVTLHVGLGTFEPVRTERLEDHVMHEEVYEIPAETADAVRRTRAAGGRIVSVGTTVVRTLEASATTSPDGLPRAEAGRTRLLIQPGYDFRVVDVLLTNFHLPRSTLLALVGAFIGHARVLDAYAEAVREEYRFYSYGDAMLLVR